MKTQTKDNRGFSLVEVLVAITLLLLVMAGPMRILSTSTKSTTHSSEQVVAYFLAQEGLELVQMGRDHLVLADFKDKIQSTSVEPDPWARFQTNFAACMGANTCGLTTTDTAPNYYAVTNCKTLTNCRLYNNATVGHRTRYTHVVAGNTVTPYTRTIKIAIINAGGGIQGAIATSTVTWRAANQVADQKVELVTYLTNVYATP